MQTSTDLKKALGTFCKGCTHLIITNLRFSVHLKWKLFIIIAPDQSMRVCMIVLLKLKKVQKGLFFWHVGPKAISSIIGHVVYINIVTVGPIRKSLCLWKKH